jgi:ATP-dependent protease ClpP protease subunit
MQTYGDRGHLFLVTKKHVIGGASIGHCLFTSSDGEKRLIGQRHDVLVHNFEAMSHGQPDPDVDIAIP